MRDKIYRIEFPDFVYINDKDVPFEIHYTEYTEYIDALTRFINDGYRITTWILEEDE